MLQKGIKRLACISLCIVVSLMFAACGTGSDDSGVSDDGHIISVTVITNVYGDGQKASAVAVEYDTAIDPGSLSVDDYRIVPVNVNGVDEYTVTSVYTNSEAALSKESSSGKFVIVELSTDYILPNYTAGDGIGEKDGDGGSGRPGKQSGERPDGELPDGGMPDGNKPDMENGGMEGGFQMKSTDSNQIQVTLVQTGDIETEKGTIYASSTEEYSNNYEDNINLLVKSFGQYTFTSSDGTELMYNLYLPDGHTVEEQYPLVLFMPDATGEGSDPVKTLTQGIGAVIWASDEVQESHACMVLAPQYESGNDSAAITMELLQSVCGEYNVDEDRIYVTGQSAGTIQAIEMLIENKDTFAGALLVAGQADDSFADRLNELAGQNVWMIASTGDARALPGMTSIVEAVESEGIQVVQGAWSAADPEDRQDSAAKSMRESGTSFYFTVLSDVVPEGITDNEVTEHMNTWRVAYQIREIRNWLLEQVKGRQ